jgi:hypothetical protein
MKEEKICPKCNGIMEEGQIQENYSIIGGIQGWIGSINGHIRSGLKGTIKINSYRCFECGYIENYAPSEERKSLKNEILRKKRDVTKRNTPTKLKVKK